MNVQRLLGLDSSRLNAYFQQIRAEILSGRPETEKLSASGLAGKILHGSASPAALTWDAVTQAEIDLIRVLPPERLALKYMRLRGELAALAGPDLAAAYVGGFPDKTDAIDEANLEVYCLDMLAQIQKLRILRKGFGRIRSYVTVFATLLALLFIFFIIRWFFAATANEQGAGYMFASRMLVLTGMLGGCVSALSRLYSTSWINGVATGTDSFGQICFSLILNFILAVIEGGIFAILLYTVFVGSIVNGSVFPAVTADRMAATPYFHIYFESALASHAEFAKALVWAFIAGFSERLVPDFIGTLGTSLRAPARA